MSLKSPSAFITLINLFSEAGSITYKNPRTRDIQIQWNVPGVGVWNGFLRINTAIPNVGLAGLQFHTAAGAQVNWPVGLIVPFVLNDQGPAPGPPVAPFPMVQNWLWVGAPGGPVMNIIVHANDYHINAVAGFSFMAGAGGAQPFQNLFIINQLQSALSFT